MENFETVFNKIINEIGIPPINVEIKNWSASCNFFDVELKVLNTFVCINEFVYMNKTIKFYAEKIKDQL